MDEQELKVRNRQLKRKALEMKVAVILLKLIQEFDDLSREVRAKPERFEQAKDLIITYSQRVVGRIKEMDED